MQSSNRWSSCPASRCHDAPRMSCGDLRSDRARGRPAAGRRRRRDCHWDPLRAGELKRQWPSDGSARRGHRVAAPAAELPAVQRPAPTDRSACSRFRARRHRLRRRPTVRHSCRAAARRRRLRDCRRGARPVLPGREPVAPAERAELARVDADLLDELLNNAGEVSIFRARIEQQMTSIEFNLAELDRTVTRLRDQLRKLEMETEAQILHKHQAEDVGAPHRLRPARTRPLLEHPAALARARRVGQRRRQHRGPARAAEPRNAEPAAAAGPRGHRSAERPDAHAHGAVPAARAAADASAAPGRAPRPARRPS